MIQEKVFQLMDAAKERIIKTMQERGITSVSLVMPWEEWANENGFNATDEPDSDYEDYCRDEAPYVIFFGKFGNVIDFAVLSVELECGGDQPCFKMKCHSDEYGDDTIHDYSVSYLSMVYVYDAMERELELEDANQTK